MECIPMIMRIYNYSKSNQLQTQLVSVVLQMIKMSEKLKIVISNI